MAPETEERKYYTDANGIRRLEAAGDGPARADRDGYRYVGGQTDADTTEATEETRTVAELREALTGAGVEFNSSAKKDELAALARENNA